jgi:hypothetical protein
MGSHYPLPANAPRAFESRYDPRDRLEQLHADRREAKAQLREVSRSQIHLALFQLFQKLAAAIL